MQACDTMHISFVSKHMGDILSLLRDPGSSYICFALLTVADELSTDDGGVGRTGLSALDFLLETSSGSSLSAILSNQSDAAAAGFSKV